MARLTQERMNDAEHWFCLPVVMLINFSLFQYLVVLYFRRRNEVRVVILLTCAFLGFSVLIPQAHPRDEMVGHLNDVSETCSTLTFLIQIIIIGRDIERKVRIRSLRLVTWGAEALTALGLFVVVLNFAEVCAPQLDISQFDGIDNIVENASLFYVFFSRFFYIATSRGIKWTLSNKKLEMGLYALFMTHELPFMLMESLTGLSWEPVQAIWHRLTLMMCILITIKEKLSSKRTKASRDATTRAGGYSKGPSLAASPPRRGGGVGGAQSNDDDSESDGGATGAKAGKSKVTSKATSNWNLKLFGGGTSTKRHGGATTSSTAASSAATVVRSGFSSLRILSLRSGGRAGRAVGVTPGPSV